MIPHPNPHCLPTTSMSTSFGQRQLARSVRWPSRHWKRTYDDWHYPERLSGLAVFRFQIWFEGVMTVVSVKDHFKLIFQLQNGYVRVNVTFCSRTNDCRVGKTKLRMMITTDESTQIAYIVRYLGTLDVTDLETVSLVTIIITLFAWMDVSRIVTSSKCVRSKQWLRSVLDKFRIVIDTWLLPRSELVETHCTCHNYEHTFGTFPIQSDTPYTKWSVRHCILPRTGS